MIQHSPIAPAAELCCGTVWLLVKSNHELFLVHRL
jgi:hypothetical protein